MDPDLGTHESLYCRSRRGRPSHLFRGLGTPPHTILLRFGSHFGRNGRHGAHVYSLPSRRADRAQTWTAPLHVLAWTDALLPGDETFRPGPNNKVESGRDVVAGVPVGLENLQVLYTPLAGLPEESVGFLRLVSHV